MILSAVVVTLSFAASGVTVSADSYTNSLVETALREKTFYHFNTAYNEVMKLTDEYTKNMLLGKLDSISGTVWRPDIGKLYALLVDMVDTKSGRIYDSIQTDIAAADIPEVDKWYLLGEVTSWGRKLVWTEDYGKGVSAIIGAWTKMDAPSISNGETVVDEIKNNYSKFYLKEELKKIKNKFNNVSPSPVFNNSGNILNYGFVTEDNGWIYYGNPVNGGKLSKTKADSKQVFKINDDEALFINVMDGWIYYLNYSDYNYIYKVKVDGTNRTRLSWASAVSLYASNGWLYYQDRSNDYKLYRMNSDGTNVVELTKDSTAFVNITGEHIYYSNFSNMGEIIRINSEGKGRAVLNNDTSMHMNVSGDWIFYQNEADKALYKIKTSGRERTLLSNNYGTELNAVGNWVYYVNKNDNDLLYRTSIDGASEEKLTDFPVFKIITAGGRLFFFDGEDNSYLLSMKEDKTGLRWFGVDSVIKEIKNVDISIFRGEPYSLPEGVIGDMSDGTQLYLPVTWKSNEVDTNRVGAYNYRGLVPNYNKDVNLNLYIVERDTTNSNIANFSNVVEKDGYIYYRNYVDGGLYKIKTDGTGRMKLSDHSPIRINIIGDWVYYFVDNERGALYKVKKDGSEETKVLEGPMEDINMIGEFIFYRNREDSEKLYKIRIDGTGKTKISDDYATNINISGEWIYYTDSRAVNEIYRIKQDGTYKEKIGSERAAFMVVEGDKIYYINMNDSRKLYVINPDGTSKKKLQDTTMKYFNIVAGRIYYTPDSGTAGLYSIAMGGGDLKTLTTDRLSDIYDYSGRLTIIGDWIYYTNISEFNKLYRIKTDGSQREEFGYDTMVNNLLEADYYLVSGDKLTLPTTVMGIMSDGTRRDVPVKWINAAPDTSKIGVYSYEGTVPNYSGKAKLTLNVVKELPIGNSGGNLGSYGTVAKSGDWIYYSNYQGFYKVKTDGTMKTKLSNRHAAHINVVGDWIYFKEGINGGGMYMYRMKTDGSNEMKLSLSYDNIHWLQVVGNWIYYIGDGAYLGKMRTDGTNRTGISTDYIPPHEGKIIINGEWIYYLNGFDNGCLYKIKLDGTGKTKLDDEMFTNYITASGDWIYYSNYNGFYKMKNDGTSKVKLANSVGYPNVVGDWIYYASENKYKKMKLDGTAVTALGAYENGFISIFDDWIYYADYTGSGEYLYRIKTDGTSKEVLGK